MREIKFRAWLYWVKKMYPVTILELHSYSLKTKDMNIEIETEDSYDEIGIETEYLMQYTGLKDKNGKEIYEGDIVRAWIDMGPAGEQPMTHAVVIDPWGCSLQEWTYKESGYLPEVIGNIYENPELLKEKA